MDEPLFETIRPRTKNLGRRIVHYATLPSTMDEARRLAAEGAENGTVVVADEQTAGRGRLDRRWYSPKGSLLATFLLRPSVRVESGPLIGVAVGVALAESITRLVRAPALVKWPNDVWIEGRKVAGILVETRLAGGAFDIVLVGLGVNGNLRVADLPADLRPGATSLSEWKQGHVCLPALLKVFAERFESYLEDLERGDPARVLSGARRLSAILGKRVRVETGGETFEGVASELGAGGELILESSEGVKVVRVGDCELLRPVA